MQKVKRHKSTYKGIKRIGASIGYSLSGIFYAIRNEKSLILYSVLSVLVIALGLFFGITSNQWIALLLSLGNILTIELINTAIEATVDMVTLENNPLAKIAKDCGSGATFVASMIAIITSLIIFVPRIIHFFGINL